LQRRSFAATFPDGTTVGSILFLPIMKPERRPKHRGSEPPARRPLAKPVVKDTSWEQSAQWYDRLIGDQGSPLYREVVLPGVSRMLRPKPREQILDLGCGQGVLCRVLAAFGAEVTGLDLSPSLLRQAGQYESAKPIRYIQRDAADLARLGPFDAITAVLCLQNMRHLDEVCQSASEVLVKNGRMLWVINHPSFRIPRQTSWGWDEENEIQFRRVDAYATPLEIPIVMHPGRKDSETTMSYHLSMEELCRSAMEAGFLLSGLEEWTSPRSSEPGPRARAENRARHEFPLFMALLWQKA
jgi:SAM-dependent methyltransferase